ncbi:MAG TPA: hypothetical protein VF064_19890, partial [Pyrinomonadaceae bacterium]
MDKLTDGAGYGSFKGGAAPPVEPVFSANVAKENHASGVAPVAVGSSAAASPRREVIPDTAARALPETATPLALAHETPSAKKAQEVDLLDATSSVNVVKTDAAAPPLGAAAHDAALAAPSVNNEETEQPFAAEAVPFNSKAEAVVALPRAVTAGAAVAPAEADDAGEGSDIAEGEGLMASSSAASALATAVAAPLNDNFAAAQLISALPGSTTGSNIGATKEAGEPFHAFNPGGASVWYKWTAPSTRTVDFSTAGSNFDTTLAVYKSTTAGLVEVASNDEASATLSTSRATFDAVAATVYYIAVDGYNDGVTTATGSITLQWSATPVPANNNFASAQVLAAATTGSATGTNRGATLETSEPYHANDDGGKSVWYKWTAPSTGNIEFSTAGSNFDTLLGVYTGTAVNALTGVAGNDEEDFNAGVHTSRVVFSAVAGTVYYIAVDGFDGGGGADWGDITLQWKVGPAAPANNNFASAQVITGDEGRIKSSNWLATKELGEPSHAQDPGGKSIWYKFQAPGSGKVYFDTMGSTVDTVMSVYTGTSVSALTLVANNDDADASAGVLTSRVGFGAVAGTIYYIAVDGSNGEAGTIVLRTPRRSGKVAFVSNRDGDDEIFTMNADGSEQTQLTVNAASDTRPDWSPDGTKIVFESSRDGNSEIYVMNADGTGQTRLTTHTASDSQPVWSPDGTRIA